MRRLIRIPRHARVLPILALTLLFATGCGTPGAAPETTPGVAAEDPDYVRLYTASPPVVEAVADFVDHTSFPPVLRAEPSRETLQHTASPFDRTDAQLDAARRTALADPRVVAALGERFVEVAIGADAPAKTEGREVGAVEVGIEFFSYTRQQPVRVSVIGDAVRLAQLPSDYQPPETAAEVVRAVRLLSADPRAAERVRGAEPEAILTQCPESIRCLHVQFVRGDRVVLSAVVDLINERVTEVLVDPDADVR